MRVRARTPQNWPSVPGHRTRHDITTALSFAAIACGCGRAGYPPTVADPLGDPAARERLLASIAPDSAAEHHAVLRDIFRREMHHRHDTGGDEFFENLYWCAFLLHPIRDPADVPMMWQAKHTDFDTAAGFDVQFLLVRAPRPRSPTSPATGTQTSPGNCLPTPNSTRICRPGPPSAEATSTDTAEPPHARQPIHAQTRSARQTPPRGRRGCRRRLPLAHSPTRRRMLVTTSWSGMVVEIS